MASGEGPAVDPTAPVIAPTPSFGEPTVAHTDVARTHAAVASVDASAETRALSSSDDDDDVPFIDSAELRSLDDEAPVAQEALASGALEVRSLDDLDGLPSDVSDEGPIEDRTLSRDVAPNLAPLASVGEAASSLATPTSDAHDAHTGGLQRVAAPASAPLNPVQPAPVSADFDEKTQNVQVDDARGPFTTEAVPAPISALESPAVETPLDAEHAPAAGELEQPSADSAGAPETLAVEPALGEGAAQPASAVPADAEREAVDAAPVDVPAVDAALSAEPLADPTPTLETPASDAKPDTADEPEAAAGAPVKSTGPAEPEPATATPSTPVNVADQDDTATPVLPDVGGDDDSTPEHTPAEGTRTPPRREEAGKPAYMDESALGGAQPSGAPRRQWMEDAHTVEGAPLFDESSETSEAALEVPRAGQTLTAPDGRAIVLESALGEDGGRMFFRASIEGEEGTFTAVWLPHLAPEPDWSTIPDARLVRPVARVDQGGACLRVFTRPKGSTVADFIGADDRGLPALAVLDLGIELAELLEGLHGAGHFLLELEPTQIVLERGGQVRLYVLETLPKAGALPMRPTGVFSAPEVRRRLGYHVGAHSDVYAVAMLVYALLAQKAPLTRDLNPAFLVSPRVFRPSCPLGIWPYLRPCLAANPMDRIAHARGLRQQLEKARRRLLNEADIERQLAAEGRTVVIEPWAELHGGLTKTRRGSEQQDRAVAMTEASGRVGMLIVADGVSRCRYGSGAFAAEQVQVCAQARWAAMQKAGAEGLLLPAQGRADVLRQIARAAGKRVAVEVNDLHAPVPNEPNQVMSTTLVGAVVVDGQVTLANLGDSRAYLVRDGTIEQIGIDHDRKTDALRMGLGFEDAAHVHAGAALTRIVGRVAIDERGEAHPDPFDPEMFNFRLLPGDRLLLCSDGLADFAAGLGKQPHQHEAVMQKVLEEIPDVVTAAYELVVLANRTGGYDNISCIVTAAYASEPPTQAQKSAPAAG